MEFEPATLTGLVSHYSPSGSEGAAVEWLVSRFNALGYTQFKKDSAGNAVGIMGSGPRQIILLGHIDTVPGEIPVHVVENVLYGRGTVDAKAALSCFVDAVARTGILEGWQLVVIGAVEEERDSDGARYIANQYRPDYAIIGEPNRWDRIGLGYKGSAWVNLTMRKAQFHSAQADKSACESAVNLWVKAKQFGEEYNSSRPKMFDQLHLTLQEMESGTEGFEQWARLRIGARLPVDIPPQKWFEILSGIAAGSKVELRGYPIPAWTCEKNTAVVRALLSAIRRAGGTPSFVYKSGTADLNIVAPSWGCPAAVYGPGDSSLDHTPNECIDLGEYRKAVECLADALMTLCKNG